jgi:hypothetical protein
MVETRRVAQEVILPSGADIAVRIDQSLDTKHGAPGTPFVAHVSAPVWEHGNILVPRGAVAYGHIVESKPSGRLKGRPVMTLALDSIEMRGRRYHVITAGRTFVGKNHKRRNLVSIGGGAAAGAAIGAIAGDGVGAAIGAGAGAAAGTVGAFVTGRKNLRLPPETRVDFALVEPIRLRG